MTVTFAEKLARIHTTSRVPRSTMPRRRAETADAIKLASNESPTRPTRRWSRRSPRGRGANRYPDPEASLLRRRIAERCDTDPARIAVSNGSCEILLAAAAAFATRAPRSSTPGPPSRSTPTCRRSPGAREIRPARRRRRPRPRCDGGGDHRGDSVADRLQPEQPDRDLPPGWPRSRVPRAVPAPRDGDPRRGLRRVPGRRRPRRDPRAPRPHPNLVLLRTFSKCYGLAGLRVGYALCSPRFRAAVDAVRQPFSVNALAQAAAAEAILHQDDVADRVESNLVERLFVEEDSRDRPRRRRLRGELLLDRPR